MTAAAPNSQTLFVTGTDTGVGKTRAACALLRDARESGVRAAGFKPVASGAELTSDGLRNDDALALLAESAPGFSYSEINPYCFAPPIAPHAAAREVGVTVDLDVLNAAHDQLAARCELVIVEGAGGWRVPLNGDVEFSDWVAAQQWPVVLVVGLRLGCINHALLSAESILRRVPLAGWIANAMPPVMDRMEATLDALRARIEAPYWGTIACGETRIAGVAAGFKAWLCEPPSGIRSDRFSILMEQTP